ncbi:unnamed protein product [Mycena citricolor]|uniref:NADH:flavin oxidoreductase/NADH oxidase N-terminal domain-containing protein n=1 Tax=Mycena citricolor TaxID=2018698 RepID=A0AAD2JVD4_9AGAR|nr:unnamed protein product [Mycena citricolor]
MATTIARNNTAALFSPLKFGDHVIRDRLAMAALTRNRSSDTVPNALMREYYVQRARGGAGLIVTEGCLVSRQGTEWENAPGIWSAEQVAGWKDIVDAVHAEGGKIYCQLWHAGRVCHPETRHQKASGEPVYGPSPIAAHGGKFRFLPGVPGYVTPTEVPDPATLIELFRLGALKAKDAGFDGVEIHGANGYLVHQFLDASSNQRTDKWGGSPENRSRFAIELLKVLVDIWGPNVGAKFTPAGGYNDMGFPLDDTIATFGHLLSSIDTLGLAYVSLVRYSDYFDPEKRGTDHDVLATYAPFLKSTPLIPNGGITSGEAAEWVASGKYPAVFLGTLWMTHPDLAKRVKFGKELANDLDGPHIYGGDFDPVIGYTDYPAAEYDQ